MLKNIFKEILDWSEVWAPLLPLLVLSFGRKVPRYLIPVVLYLWFALAIDTFIDIGWKFSGCVHVRPGELYNHSGCVPNWMYPNNYLYNIHSLGRLLCFSVFFYQLTPVFRTRLDQLLLAAAVVFILVNFWYAEPFYNRNMFSSRLFALESGLLLFYCLRYYLFEMPTVTNIQKKGPLFWVVTGLSVYVVFNFPLFLFYSTLIANNEYRGFVIAMWNFHNITFVILCIFIAKAFYVVGDQ